MPRPNYKELFAPWLTSNVVSITGEVKGYCPRCEDPATSSSPSASFNFEKNVWHCNGRCGEGGSFAQLKKLMDSGDIAKSTQEDRPVSGEDFLKPAKREPTPLPSEDEIARWHDAVWEHAQFLREQRGLTADTIRQFRLGYRLEWDGYRYTIPVYDGGKLVNVKRYKPNAPAKDKMLNWPGTHPTLFICGDLEKATAVVVCEGELDAMLLHQVTGAVTASGTGGAPTWRTDWSERLAGKTVYLWYDCDVAGRDGAAKAAASLLPFAKETLITDLGLEDGGDVTDLILPKLGDVEALRRELKGLIEWETRRYELPEEEELPWPELDEAAYHGPVGEIVRELEPATEADPNGVLATLLVTLGNKLGLGTWAEAGAERHPGRLYSLLVGETALARKGTAWAIAKVALALLDPQWVASFASGMSTGEGLLKAFEEGEGQRTEVDATLDAEDLVGLFESSSQNLVVFEAEFARMMTAASREGNTLSAVQRELYDSDRARIMTKEKPIRVAGANLSILGHITIGELKKKLTDTDIASGFANRYLFFLVRRTKKLPHGRRVDMDALEELVVKLQANLEKAGGKLERTAEADKVWERAYYRWSEEPPTDILGHLVARAPTHGLRLSVIYAALDGAKEIRPEHVRAAVAIVDYHIASVTYLYGDESKRELREELYAVVRKAGDGGISKTDQARRLGGHYSATALQEARKGLERDGLIVTVEVPTAGRKKYVSKVKK